MEFASLKEINTESAPQGKSDHFSSTSLVYGSFLTCLRCEQIRVVCFLKAGKLNGSFSDQNMLRAKKASTSSKFDDCIAIP